jgi:flagellin
MSVKLGQNIQSLRIQRNLSNNTNQLNSATERLSTGMRINRGKDDAAGLAITEKLNVDQRLSSAALRNVNDGIAMLNIVSSALDSQKTIVNRMLELAEQSANGVYSNEQRRSLQNEYYELQMEFDRIAETAEFNDINLLRDPNESVVNLMVGITGADESLLSVLSANSHRFSGKIALISDFDGDGINFSDLDGVTYSMTTLNPDYANSPYSIFQDYAELRTKDSGGNDVTLRFSFSRLFDDIFTGDANSPPTSLALVARAFLDNGESVDLTNLSYQTDNITSLDFNFNFATAGTNVAVSLDLSGFEYDWYGDRLYDGSIRANNIGFTNLSSQPSSRLAIDVLKNKLEDLTDLQSRFAVNESRMYVGASLLDVNKQVLSDAKSRILDADIAEESAKLIKSRILQDTSAALLAQANQNTNLVNLLL